MDYVERLINASAAARAASLAALAKSTSDFHAELSTLAVAAKSASSAASRFADRCDRMNSSSAAAKAGFGWRLWRRRVGGFLRRPGRGVEGCRAAATHRRRPSSIMVESTAADQQPWIKPEGLQAK